MAPTNEKPDCITLANYFRKVGDEVELFQSLPALDIGAALLERMDRLMLETASFRREVQSELTSFRREVQSEFMSFRREVQSEFTSFRREVQSESTSFRQEFDIKLRAMNKNISSRLVNQWALSPEVSLSPMYNVSTGDEIANCPKTLAALEQCNSKHL
ncbi:hypothetical protein UVI_02050080 [Ustilaginoidea virens]|uniref:Uncharacterized protein n=1 Tax=Ustilaginoidea virens TaxID=1159556 RepID=A0A063BN46_USTVR|nr:hypothetical protein UVI_02050080 [Ustilaginoidea virens]